MQQAKASGMIWNIEEWTRPQPAISTFPRWLIPHRPHFGQDPISQAAKILPPASDIAKLEPFTDRHQETITGDVDSRGIIRSRGTKGQVCSF
jgi:hypothetical protein